MSDIVQELANSAAMSAMRLQKQRIEELRAEVARLTRELEQERIVIDLYCKSNESLCAEVEQLTRERDIARGAITRIALMPTGQDCPKNNESAVLVARDYMVMCWASVAAANVESCCLTNADQPEIYTNQQQCKGASDEEAL